MSISKEQINQLARRLEAARDIQDLYRSVDAKRLIDELERYAYQDFYGANRLWKEYASEQLRTQPEAKPLLLRVADISEKHFEGRATQERNPVQLFDQKDTVVGRPESGHKYEGKIVGNTPDYAVQQLENGDFILHRRRSLTLDPSTLGKDVRIHYPFGGVTGVGSVTIREHEHQTERELTRHSPLQKTHSHEQEFER